MRIADWSTLTKPGVLMLLGNGGVGRACGVNTQRAGQADCKAGAFAGSAEALYFAIQCLCDQIIDDVHTKPAAALSAFRGEKRLEDAGADFW